jgi:hypothetical protein
MSPSMVGAEYKNWIAVARGGGKTPGRAELLPVLSGLPPLGRSRKDWCHLAGVTHTHHLAGQLTEGAKVGIGALPGLVDQKHVGTGQVGIDVAPAGGGGDLCGGVRCDRGPRCSPNG